MRPYEFLSFPPECNVRNHTFHDIAAPLSSNEFEVGSSYESDATAGSKARKIFALRNRPVSCHEQAANTHARTHARALCLIPPDGGRFSNRFSFFAPNFRTVPQIYRPPPSRTNICLPPSPLSSPPRFNPWPQNQFAAGGSRDFRQQPQQPGLSSPSSTREERICGKRGYKNVREYPRVVRFAAQNRIRNGTSESLLFYSPLGE